MTWSFAPGRCLTITRRAPTPRVLRQWLFSALKASSTPAVPMAFRAHTPPFCLVNMLPTPTHSACTTWPCFVATLDLAVYALHRLLSPTCHCLAFLLSCAFSSIRHGSLLTSRTSSNLTSPDPNANNMNALPVVFTHLGFWTRLQPGKVPASIPRCGRDHQCAADPFLFTTSWELAVRIDIWLSRRT